MNGEYVLWRAGPAGRIEVRKAENLPTRRNEPMLSLREAIDRALTGHVDRQIAKSAGGMTRPDAIRKALADEVVNDTYRLSTYPEASMPVDEAMRALYRRFSGDETATEAVTAVFKWLARS